MSSIRPQIAARLPGASASIHSPYRPRSSVAYGPSHASPVRPRFWWCCPHFGHWSCCWEVGASSAGLEAGPGVPFSRPPQTDIRVSPAKIRFRKVSRWSGFV